MAMIDDERRVVDLNGEPIIVWSRPPSRAWLYVALTVTGIAVGLVAAAAYIDRMAPIFGRSHPPVLSAFKPQRHDTVASKPVVIIVPKPIPASPAAIVESNPTKHLDEWPIDQRIFTWCQQTHAMAWCRQ
jgi:hypothetical protein